MLAAVALAVTASCAGMYVSATSLHGPNPMLKRLKQDVSPWKPSPPFYAATQSLMPGFTIENSTRLHNRPLYGAHNGGLVLSGDRPIVHLADDRTLFGGFLFGLVRGSVGVWAHNASHITSMYIPGTLAWSISDSSLPGLTLSARLLPTSDGIGMLMDLNVTDSSGGEGGDAEVVWAFGCGTVPASPNPLGWLYEPLINTDVLTWDFTPKDCVGNHVNITNTGSFSVTFGGASVHATLATTTSSNLTIASANDVADILNLTSSDSFSRHGSSQLPIGGASLWLRASSLISQGLPNGSFVSLWSDESGNGHAVSQNDSTRLPLFDYNGLGVGGPGVRFDGLRTFLANPNASVGSASTMFAVFRDEGSSGGVNGPCCSGVLFYKNSFDGISTLPAQAGADDDDGNSAPGGAVVTKLDYAGSPANGHLNVYGRTIIAVSLYSTSGPSSFFVDGCSQGDEDIAGTPGSGVMVGTRNNELGRYFKGVVGEVVVFPWAMNASELKVMHEYFYASWPSMPVKKTCTPSGPLAVGRSPVAMSTGAAPAMSRYTWVIASGSAISGSDPLTELAAADARVRDNTATFATTPDPLVDAAVSAMGPAIDGLWRSDPPVFVHGAMAWDVSLVGWRSQYGATVYGRSDLVAAQGAYFFGRQVQDSPNTVCVSDVSKLMTQESPSSRLYGRGRISGGDGMYDMQSQMFDQQVHMWRWTGNVSHEAILRPALALHAEWATDVCDADGNGLFASYINTWPTDSQWYNGGETYEETSYMYTAHRALRDMAMRAGNATDAATHEAVMVTIEAALPSLWVQGGGHPSAFREEGGHRRLRPDAWLYSVFLPIEAGLFSVEEAAQALHYSEWALQRDDIACDEKAGSEVCGQVVWTSNWVPSMWSVRQLWPGDNYALALAYYLTGLPSDGYTVLAGNLHRDMLQSTVPGMTGGANGGTDFNDCVHPLSRALVEGLFGYRPDYVAGIVTLAPQPPPEWPNATLTTADVSLSYSQSLNSVALTCALSQAAEAVVVRLPVRAQAVDTTRVTVTGIPVGATWNVTIESGFGQSVAVITLAANAAPPEGISTVNVSVPFTNPLPYTPSVYMNVSAGASVVLDPPGAAGALSIVSFSDPQGVFIPGSAVATQGTVTGTIAANVSGTHMVIAYANTTDSLPQILLYKLTVMQALLVTHSALTRPAIEQATWAYVPISAALNGDMSAMFTQNTYLSPRPQTCGVRIGTDGYSAWTFPWWGSPVPPVPTFNNLQNMSIGNGVIATPQGAQFLLNVSAGEPNIAFASLWDNYPTSLNVSVQADALQGATAVWVLVAGSTNPMQTLLANAVLRFHYADGSFDALELVPPMNFWALSGWGNNDYDYSTDAFCLPAVAPPTVQLGAGNRAMVYSHPLLVQQQLVAVELEVLSQEVVIGLLAVSLMA